MPIFDTDTGLGLHKSNLIIESTQVLIFIINNKRNYKLVLLFPELIFKKNSKTIKQ